MLKLIEGEVEVHSLRNVEAGYEIDRDGGNNAKSANVDDGGLKRVTIAVAGKVQNGAVRPDKFEGTDLGAKILVTDSRAVRGRCDGTANGDMRQRGQVVKRETSSVQHGREFAVGYAGTYCGSAGLGIDTDGLHGAHADLCVLAVRRVVEGMTGTKTLEPRIRPDNALHLIPRSRRVHLVGAEMEVLRPVGAGNGGVIAQNGLLS